MHSARFAGQVVVVTGAARGIGLALAEAFAREGAALALADVDAAPLAAQARRLANAHGVRTCAVAGDLSQEEAAAELLARTQAELGAAQVLVNNAGGGVIRPFLQHTSQTLRQTIDRNLWTVLWCTRAFLPGMVERGYGRILNIASLQSTRAFAHSAPYGAAKGGVVQLTRAIAQAWSGRGITCNAIGPGFFPTALTAPVFSNPELAAMHASRTAIGRNGELQDLHGAAIFLCSPASAYITGQTLMVDGGYTAL